MTLKMTEEEEDDDDVSSECFDLQQAIYPLSVVTFYLTSLFMTSHVCSLEPKLFDVCHELVICSV